MKFFTIRSDGTINVDGVLLNVYKTERSNLVFVPVIIEFPSDQI